MTYLARFGHATTALQPRSHSRDVTSAVRTGPMRDRHIIERLRAAFRHLLGRSKPQSFQADPMFDKKGRVVRGEKVLELALSTCAAPDVCRASLGLGVIVLHLSSSPRQKLGKSPIGQNSGSHTPRRYIFPVVVVLAAAPSPAGRGQCAPRNGMR